MPKREGIELLSQKGKIILALLKADKPLLANEVAILTGFDISQVCKQLKVLQGQGFVDRGKGRSKKDFSLSEKLSKEIHQKLPAQYNNILKQIEELNKQREAFLIQTYIEVFLSSPKK